MLHWMGMTAREKVPQLVQPAAAAALGRRSLEWSLGALLPA